MMLYVIRECKDGIDLLAVPRTELLLLRVRFRRSLTSDQMRGAGGVVRRLPDEHFGSKVEASVSFLSQNGFDRG